MPVCMKEWIGCEKICRKNFLPNLYLANTPITNKHPCFFSVAAKIGVRDDQAPNTNILRSFISAALMTCKKVTS